MSITTCGWDTTTTCSKPVAIVAPICRSIPRDPEAVGIALEVPGQGFNVPKHSPTTPPASRGKVSPNLASARLLPRFQFTPEATQLREVSTQIGGDSEHTESRADCQIDSRKNGNFSLEKAFACLSMVQTSSSQPSEIPGRRRKEGDFSEAVRHCNFYYVNMTNSEAKSRLRGSSVGTFLLRDSSDPRFQFSLSVKTSRGTTSVRVSRTTSGHYRLDSDPHQQALMSTFPNILSLVEHYFLSASSSVAGGKYHKHCVLLESSGRSDTPMLLIKPLELSPASLAHLCRRLINNRVTCARQRHKLISRMADLDDGRKKAIQHYLLDYPFRL